VLEFCHQPTDHPVLLTMPESEYLRGYLLRVE
jgi:23S rRNA (cytosine1962-C5)-methyltransferase